MEAARRRHGIAAVGCIAALLVGMAALTPGASASGTIHRCANRSETIEFPGVPGSAPTKFKLVLKTISTQGVSCAAAYKFLDVQTHNTQTATPEKYKCKIAHFKVPLGYVAQVCSRPGKQIQYSTRGG